MTKRHRNGLIILSRIRGWGFSTSTTNSDIPTEEVICGAGTKILSRNETTSLEESCSRVLAICNQKSIRGGVCVHSSIIKLGLQDRLYLNNNLLNLYAKCSGIQEARHFFDEMLLKDVVSWTGTVSAYGRSGEHEKALQLFDTMLASGQYPNEFTLSSVLRSCSALARFDYGTCVQGFIIKHGLDENPIIGSYLVDLYSKNGSPEEAYRLFSCLDFTDTVSWTMIISSFVSAERWDQAMKLYFAMVDAGVPPSEFTFVKLLSASHVLGLDHGKLIHAHMMLWGLKMNVILKTTLVHMYSRWQKMEEAVKVSKLTPEFDTALWTAVISGYTQNFRLKEAIDAFCEMEISGTAPNNFTYSCLLTGCSSLNLLELGKQFHSRVLSMGMEADVSVGNALVDMYAKCSASIQDAWKAFHGLSSPNVISWTSLIAGISAHGFYQFAYELFMQMQAAGIEPNSFTLSAMLGTCSAVRSFSQTSKLHPYIIKAKLDQEIAVQNGLLDAYARAGMLDEAWAIFVRMGCKDVVTYTSLATRMSKIGHHGWALNIISEMYNNDIGMDEVSLPSFLSAAAGFGAAETGKQLHCQSIKSGLAGCLSVSNGLIDLYGKCGCITDAQSIFKEISCPDAVSWNGLISVLASSGHIKSALSAFDEMRLSGVRPDKITFLSVLSACKNGGLVELGLEYFDSMQGLHDIIPQLEHYVYLVDLLGQAGQLEKASEVVHSMPVRPNALIYKTLLRACKVHKSVALAEHTAANGLELDPLDPAFYLLLASLYETCGRNDLKEQTLLLMKERGLKRNTGQSRVEIRAKRHLFVAGDTSHPQLQQIHQKIESLLTNFKNCGYTYHAGDSIYHSEKLAIAFGLLNTPPRAPIRIVKNSSTCMDCHEFLKFVTCVTDNEVILREGSRLHSFIKDSSGKPLTARWFLNVIHQRLQHPVIAHEMGYRVLDAGLCSGSCWVQSVILDNSTFEIIMSSPRIPFCHPKN